MVTTGVRETVGQVIVSRRRVWRRTCCAAGVVAILLLSACSGSSAPKASSTTSSAVFAPTTSGRSATSGVTLWAGKPVSTAAIPLGDGHLSSSPRIGYVDSCTSQFRRGGAQHSGPWLDSAAGSWDLKTKIDVQGSVSWPNASHSFTLSGVERILTTDDLPSGEPTGNFPIASSDPAYAYDHNPNHIAAQSFTWTVPADPSAAASPSCLGLGPVGVSSDGVVFFDALDASGRDAGAHEIQDSCAGHPQMQGIYHYHTYSSCLGTGASDTAGSSILVGYGLDGYGIYLERDANGNLPTDADLDACHGRTSRVMWDGRSRVMYHYDITAEYPYTLGCYHGTPVNQRSAG